MFHVVIVRQHDLDPTEREKMSFNSTSEVRRALAKLLPDANARQAIRNLQGIVA
jgi:hypothetical protein